MFHPQTKFFFSFATTVPDRFGAMAESQWFRGQCPLCQKKIAGSDTHEDVFKKLLWHLQSSEKHPMEEAEAAQHIAEAGNCIWEDGEGKFEDKPQDAETKARLRSRSRSRSYSRRRGKGKGSSSSKGKKGTEVVPYTGKGQKGLSKRDQQLVTATTERVISSVVADQANEVFAFAKTLGKCEAVIRTATRVARQAVSAFEDTHMFHGMETFFWLFAVCV